MTYTVGFLFSPTMREVLLIEKNRPAWQAGKLNGIGGKRQEDEPAFVCQVREFEEEAGVRVLHWREIGSIEGPECYDENMALKYPMFHVTVFAACAHLAEWDAVKAMTDEPIHKVPVHDILYGAGPFTTIPNLKWLIPMAGQSLLGVYNETKFRVIEHA